MALGYTITITRPNGQEEEITKYATRDLDDSQIRTLRESALGSARLSRFTQRRRIRVYGPNDFDTPPTADDLILDSDTDI